MQISVIRAAAELGRLEVESTTKTRIEELGITSVDFGPRPRRGLLVRDFLKGHARKLFCRVWADAATGRLLQDGNLNVVWWSAP